MGKGVVFTQPRTVEFESYDDLPLGPHELRVRTLFSGISAGTEMTAYRGSNPYLSKQWDPKNRLFLSSEAPSQPYPLSGWGYEEVGEVIEIVPDTVAFFPQDWKGVCTVHETIKKVYMIR